MEVILLSDVDNVGQAGDVVKVKEGFARNFLIPKKKAVVCTKGNRKMVEEQKQLVARQKEKEKAMLQQLAEKIAGISCTISAQAGEEDKLFGAVTNADIQKALLAEGIDLDKRKILMDEPIKQLGIYTVNIALHPDIQTSVKVWVVKE